MAARVKELMSEVFFEIESQVDEIQLADQPADGDGDSTEVLQKKELMTCIRGVIVQATRKLLETGVADEGDDDEGEDEEVEKETDEEVD